MESDPRISIRISGLTWIRIRISSKLLWIYYIVGVSHFAEKLHVDACHSRSLHVIRNDAVE